VRLASLGSDGGLRTAAVFFSKRDISGRSLLLLQYYVAATLAALN